MVGLTGNMSVNPSLFAKLPYDPLADFVPVAMLATYPFLVVVNNDLPVKTIGELVTHLKANPGWSTTHRRATAPGNISRLSCSR